MPAARRRARPPSRRFSTRRRRRFPQAGWEARARSNVSPDFSRDLDRFGEFLALVGLISLVVGGVGVANAAQGFVERKRATLAILKALGASGGAVVALALVEFLAAALIGIGAGAGDRGGDALRRRGAVRSPSAVAARAGDLPERTGARRALRRADRADLFRRAAGARPRHSGLPIVSQPRRDARRAAAPSLFRRRGAGGATLAGAAILGQSAAQCRDRRRRGDGARACRAAPRRRRRDGAGAAGAARPFGRLAHGDRQSSPARRPDPFGRPVARARPGGARRADPHRFQSARPVAPRHARAKRRASISSTCAAPISRRSAAFSASRRRRPKSSRRR